MGVEVNVPKKGAASVPVWMFAFLVKRQNSFDGANITLLRNEKQFRHKPS
jgi:hypothetical protein